MLSNRKIFVTTAFDFLLSSAGALFVVGDDGTLGNSTALLLCPFDCFSFSVFVHRSKN